MRRPLRSPRQPGHRTSSDDEHPLVVERTELAGQKLVRSAHQRRPAEPIPVSVCTRLPTRIACWNKELRTRPQFRETGQESGRLHLPENLALTDHKRVKWTPPRMHGRLPLVEEHRAQ